MKTVITTYRFDISIPEEREEWENLYATLKETHKLFNAWGRERGRIASGEIELDTKTVFSNQWNSNQGRVFDWFLDAHPNLLNSTRQGHYLELTKEMIEIRNNTYRCGFCGNQKTLEKSKWCDKCLDSEYLEKEQLHLTWMIPVAKNRRKLSDKRLFNRIKLFKETQYNRKVSPLNKEKILEPYKGRIIKAQLVG